MKRYFNKQIDTFFVYKTASGYFEERENVHGATFLSANVVEKSSSVEEKKKVKDIPAIEIFEKEEVIEINKAVEQREEVGTP